jgi:2-polyprenyl-3-methyl-5-hydroxy-6-metoxy-1,4-benzoquinol methylase
VSELPLHGFNRRVVIPVVDSLSDEQLRELNEILPWNCFLADSHGRRFGKPTSETKRNAPQKMPDPRVVQLDNRISLRDLTVLEIGCFEGVHTVALAQRAKHVKACDGRVANVVKTSVRCAMFQVAPTLFAWDVEQAPPADQDISCDILHHVGVLYHLADPVSHLERVAPFVRQAVMLDTHCATPAQALDNYEANGRTYQCMVFAEGGREEPFSGLYPTARWLLLEDIAEVLTRSGFGKVELLEDRAERNGRRVLIIAER